MTMIRGALSIAIWLGMTGAGQTESARSPYLAGNHVPDGIAILQPPPAVGSAAAEADRAIFAKTRKLQGSPRWRIAIEDVSNAPLDRYACALDITLTPASAPAVARLLDRSGTGDLVQRVKAHYRIQRPYLGTQASICEPKTEHLAKNGDYPSGHAANGWLEGLILAQLVPERATAILARARAYGESRAVCGSHSASAVQAGWMAGSAMFAVLGSTRAFHRDFEAAHKELASIRSSAPVPDRNQCWAEQATLARSPWGP